MRMSLKNIILVHKEVIAIILVSCLSHSVEILRELQFWVANVIYGNLITGSLPELELQLELGLFMITFAMGDDWTPMLERLTAHVLGDGGHVDHLIIGGCHLGGIQDV